MAVSDFDDTNNNTPREGIEPGNFWSDPDLETAAAGGNYVKFVQTGDRVKGTVATLGKHIWEDGSVAAQVWFAEPDVPILTASQLMLQRGLFALKPLKGDKLEVELVRIERLPGGRILKHFSIMVTRADGTTEKFPSN